MLLDNNVDNEDNNIDYLVQFQAAQEAFLNIAPKVSSMLSLLGSGWILLEVWVFSRKRYFVYHRLVSAMACYNSIACIGYFTSNWLASSAVATSVKSCQAQGFLVQWQLGSIIYFAVLGIYYMLVISNSYSEEAFGRLERWCFHAIPMGASLATSIVGIPLNLYHQGGGSSTPWCWIYPTTTTTQQKRNSSDVSAYQWGLYLAPAWACFLIMTVALWKVFQGVQRQEQRMQKYLLQQQQQQEEEDNYDDENDDNAEDQGSSIFRPSKKSSSEKQRRSSIQVMMDGVRGHMTETARVWKHMPRTKQVMSQAVCYLAPHFLLNLVVTLVVVFVNNMAQVQNMFAVLAIQAFFQPLQGFWIFLAYRRPTYLRFRNKGTTVVQSIRQTLQFDYGAWEKKTTTTSFQQQSSSKRSSLFGSFFMSPWRKQCRASSSSNATAAQTAGMKYIEAGTTTMVSGEPDNGDEDGDENDENRRSSSSTPQDHRQSFRHSGKESSSTIGTQQSSVSFSNRNDNNNNNVGSSRNLGLTKTNSLQLSDLLMLDDSSSGGDSSSNGNNHHDDINNNEGDQQQQQQRPPKRPSREALMLRNRRRANFRQMKEQSQRFFDLVCMDIIPEAEGPPEEQMWQRFLIEEPSFRNDEGEHNTTTMNYEKGHQSYNDFQDKSYRYNKNDGSNNNSNLDDSVDSIVLESDFHRRPPENQSSNVSRVFAKIKSNPLFRISGRNIMQKETGDDISNNNSPIGPPKKQRSLPARTRSGDYYSVKMRGRGKAQPDTTGFLTKLDMEKKRKEVLKAISERSMKKKEHGCEEEEGDIESNNQQQERGQSSSSPALAELNKKRLELMGEIIRRQHQVAAARQAENNNTDQQQSPSGETPDATENGATGGGGSLRSRFDLLDKKRKEMLSSISTRRSNRKLGRIEEVSEHEDSHSSFHHNSSRNQQNFFAPSNACTTMTTPASVIAPDTPNESSNELSTFSLESKAATVVHSNRSPATRRSTSSYGGFSTDDDISLVSSTPLSEDFDDDDDDDSSCGTSSGSNAWQSHDSCCDGSEGNAKLEEETPIKEEPPVLDDSSSNLSFEEKSTKLRKQLAAAKNEQARLRESLRQLQAEGLSYEKRPSPSS